MQIRILFIFFIVCWSACPNNCSNHGKCNSDGSCTCFKQSGLALNGAYFNEYTYTGPDCSLRTCPKAFGFSSKAEVDEWYKNVGPEFTMQVESNCLTQASECKEMNLPEVDYIEVLTVSAIDPALEDYGLGGSMSCFSKSSKRMFRKAYTILDYKVKNEKNYLYGILDIDSEEYEGKDNEKETLYCSIDYVRKDLSLFVNFQFKGDDSKIKGEVTLRHDLSMILQNYLYDTTINPTVLPTANSKGDETVKQTVNIGCIRSTENKNSELVQLTAKLSRTKCVNNDEYCIKVNVDSSKFSNVNANDKCFFLEAGYSHKYKVTRNITLESSEIYNLMGKNSDGTYIFGRYNYDSAIGYYSPSNVDTESDLGTVITNTDTINPTDEYIMNNDSVTIDFSKYCAGMNCYNGLKRYSDLKSFGEFFQYISYGAHVNVIRLLTTREVEDKSGVGATATDKPDSPSTIWVEDHGCYAHLVQLTIRDYTIDNNKVTLHFNRPYHFNSESSHNHYAYLFQFVGDGSHVPVECSGVGECDRTTGQCQCLPGFDGDACQRVSCPNNCNDRGRCVASSDLYSGVVNEGFGSSNNFGEARLMACKCDIGFRGPDCSLKECPSKKDPLGEVNENGESGFYSDCTGHGLCDYNTGLCSCFDGYSGEACETVQRYN